MIYDMPVPAASSDHPVDVVCFLSPSGYAMMTNPLRQDSLTKTVLQIAGDHFDQQVQFVALVIKSAFFTERKAAFDLIDRGPTLYRCFHLPAPC